ncbi:hypothetical protein ABIE78_005098 [Sinorhizobium fredii]|jgi:hypothetical protein
MGGGLAALHFLVSNIGEAPRLDYLLQMYLKSDSI